MLAVLLSLAALVVVLATPFAQWLGDLLGIGDTAVKVWTTVDWPFFFLVAVAVWLVASAVFSLYLANFGSYDRVYGVLGTGIAFLVWAWILDLTLLGGLEVSVALGRRGSSHPGGAGR